MKKIIAFGASNSKQSINKRLATHVAHLFSNCSVEILDLNDFEMPIYSIDREKEFGISNLATLFYAKLSEADLLIISLAEHNGSYTAAFKNIFDWVSRYNTKFFQNKPTLLLATSPGARGGITVLELAKERFARHDAKIIGAISVPNFNLSFDDEMGIINIEIKNTIDKLVFEIEEKIL